MSDSSLKNVRREDVVEQLRQLGYHNVPDEVVDEFLRDLQNETDDEESEYDDNDDAYENASSENEEYHDDVPEEEEEEDTERGDSINNNYHTIHHDEDSQFSRNITRPTLRGGDYFLNEDDDIDDTNISHDLSLSEERAIKKKTPKQQPTQQQYRPKQRNYDSNDENQHSHPQRKRSLFAEEFADSKHTTKSGVTERATTSASDIPQRVLVDIDENQQNQRQRDAPVTAKTKALSTNSNNDTNNLQPKRNDSATIPPRGTTTKAATIAMHKLRVSHFEDAASNSPRSSANSPRSTSSLSTTSSLVSPRATTRGLPSVIYSRPWTATVDANGRRRKHDPVSLYHHTKNIWDHDSFLKNNKNDHKKLRWQVRCNMSAVGGCGRPASAQPGGSRLPW